MSQISILLITPQDNFLDVWASVPKETTGADLIALAAGDDDHSKWKLRVNGKKADPADRIPDMSRVIVFPRVVS